MGKIREREGKVHLTQKVRGVFKLLILFKRGTFLVYGGATLTRALRAITGKRLLKLKGGHTPRQESEVENNLYSA